MHSSHNAIPSPCIKNCCLDTDDVCLGCFRTLSEITRWTQVDDKTRQQFVTNAKTREMVYKQQAVLF